MTQLAQSKFNNPFPRATDGVQVAYANFNGAAEALSHTLASILTANTTYTLTIDIGNRNDVPAGGYVTQLFAGATQLAIDNNTLTVPTGGWVTSTLTYTALPTDPLLGQSLKIQFQAVSGVQVNYDNVRLVSTVPEPSQALLIIAGLGVLLMRRGRGNAQTISAIRGGS